MPVFVVVCALLVITLVGGQALMSMREQQKSLLDTLNDQVDIIRAATNPFSSSTNWLLSSAMPSAFPPRRRETPRLPQKR